MAGARGRGLRPGSIVRSVGRLVLLVGLGFGAGLVIGVLSEEPTLLAGHLRGESESVSLDARSGRQTANEAEWAGAGARAGEAPVPGVGGDQRLATRTVEDVGADEAGPGTGSEVDDDPEALQAKRLALLEGRPSGTSEERARPGVAAAGDRPVSRPTTVRAGSAAAEEGGRWAIQVGAFSDSKSASGLATRLQSKGYPVELIPASQESTRWRVRVQPVEGKARAQGLAERLKQEERLPTWLISLEADAGS